MQTFEKRCVSRSVVCTKPSGSRRSTSLTTRPRRWSSPTGSPLSVTHDQAEAMVISDRSAVLERGRVAQVGTAEDLFERPQTRFVAQFIGRTNLVEGVVTEPGVVAVRGEPRSGGEPSP